ncbi:MAG: HAD hydrolase-like protein [Calditrichia bacterium]
MNRKLILFDIDGTLISTRGVAAVLMAEAVSQVLHKPIQWTYLDFVGNTDRNILLSLLRRNSGVGAPLEEMVQEALEVYLARLEGAMKTSGVARILPGVKKLLRELSADHSFALGLLTGNVRRGAQYKLRPLKLESYFPIGAFGDDALKRDDLPPFAIQRAEKYYRCFFEREDTWIIGDSLNDIKCARNNHLRSLAVATGRMSTGELEQGHPTALLPDLADTKKVISILTS